MPVDEMVDKDGAVVTLSACSECGFDWSMPLPDAVRAVVSAPHRYAELFGPMPDRNRSDNELDGVWPPVGYLWHMVDVLRFGTERLWTLCDDPDRGVAPWDENDLAELRVYPSLSVTVGLRALRVATREWALATMEAPERVSTPHPEFGSVDAAWIILRNAHEALHHEQDIRLGLRR